MVASVCLIGIGNFDLHTELIWILIPDSHKPNHRGIHVQIHIPGFRVRGLIHKGPISKVFVKLITRFSHHCRILWYLDYRCRYIVPPTDTQPPLLPNKLQS